MDGPRDVVHDTYRHVFRNTESMTREWVSAIAKGRTVQPDLATGARIQELVAAALASIADNGRWQPTPMTPIPQKISTAEFVPKQ